MTRRIAVEFGLITYSMLALVEPLMRGKPRREALRASWALLVDSPFNAAHGLVMDQDEEHSTRCVASTCETLLNFGRDQDQFGGQELMPVEPGVFDNCMLAADFIRRIMLGEQEGDALRNAADAAAGRPRARRTPVPDEEVLLWTRELMRQLKRPLDRAGAL